MKLTLRIIAILSLIVSIIWMIVYPSFDPLLAFLAGITALITSFFVDKPKGGTEMLSEKSSDLSVNSGRDTIVDGDIISGDKTTITNTINIFPGEQSRIPMSIPDPDLDFVGREQEIDQIVKFLGRSEEGVMTAIYGINGMGGLGKTQLAFAATKRLKNSFPDARIIIELRGESKNPPLPYQALQMAIQAIDSQVNLPDNLNALQTIYRSLLYNKRALILADNARDRAQLEPLIPPPGSALLITSRRRFSLPGMSTLELTPLSPEQSQKLLLKICPRIADNALHQAGLCGYLPLALRVSASLLADDDTRSVENYLKALDDEREKLLLLQDPDDPNNPEVSVEASIRLSYDALGDELNPIKQMLCQISVFPGSFESEALRAIVDIPNPTTIDESFGMLRRRSFIDKEKETERYRLHDLIRAFAKSRLGKKERANIELRYSKYYLAYAAAKWKDNYALEIEQFNILQGLEYAYIAWKDNLENKELASLILNTVQQLGVFMSSKGSFRNRIEWGKKALEIAEHNNDINSIANLCAYHISWSLLQQGDYELVREYCDRGLNAAMLCTDLKAAGIAAHNRAGAERDSNEVSKARDWANITLKFAQESGNEQLRRYAVLDMGYANLLEKESDSYARAESLFRELMELEKRDYSEGKDNEELVANRSMDVGLALLNQGRFDESIKLYEDARKLGEKISHQTVIGEAEFGLAINEQALRNAQRAKELTLSAKNRFERAGVTRLARVEQFCFIDIIKSSNN